MPDRDATETERLITRLRFRHLRLIVELERGGSLRAAAQTLHLTQPALSKALGELEGAFGFDLFTRTPRGLTPTARGEIAVRGAAMLLAELVHLRAEAAAGDGGATVVRIGAPPFVAQGYLPPVLARLARREPPVRVRLLEERVPLLLEALAGGELDALVTSYPAQMPAPTSMLRRLIDESFMRAGLVPPQPVVESTSPVTNVQLVAAGLGISAAPAATVRHEQAIGRVQRVRVSPPILPGPVALICRADVDNPRVALLREALA